MGSFWSDTFMHIIDVCFKSHSDVWQDSDGPDLWITFTFIDIDMLQ